MPSNHRPPNPRLGRSRPDLLLLRQNTFANRGGQREDSDSARPPPAGKRIRSTKISGGQACARPVLADTQPALALADLCSSLVPLATRGDSGCASGGGSLGWAMRVPGMEFPVQA